jgi:tripartite-type tricarboxylate transporter receptor subunit TctC
VKKLAAIFSIVLAACAMLAPDGARAQSFPNKPVKIVVPYPPGGAADTIARILGQYMAESLGQPLVVENKPGAQGAIGTLAVAKSPADGYTLLLFDSGVLMINPLLEDVGYDPAKDFTSVGLAGVSPYAVIVNSNLPVKSLRDLAAVAKAKPDQVKFAAGSATSRLTGELFQLLAGAKMLYVPYKGGAAVVNDLMGGHVDVSVAAAPSVVPMVAGGKVRALAVTGSKRLAALPDVPTSKDAGYPEFEVLGFNGLVAPAGTPAPVIATLHAALAKTLQNPEAVQKLQAAGFDPTINSPAEMDGLTRSELARWKKVIDSAGIKP